MKRLYIGTGLLVLVLVTGLVLTAVFAALHDPLAQKLDEAAGAALAGDWEKALDLTQTARQDWEKLRHFTAAVADHEPLEEMDCLFAQLQVLEKIRDAQDFAAVCAQLARQADAMGRSQGVGWWSLL